jgi:hypothetical protein
MGSAQCWSALEQLQAVGGEDANKRPLLDVCETLDGSTVGGHALRRPRLKPDRQLVAAGAV